MTISDKNLEINSSEITVKGEDIAAGTKYITFEFKGTSSKGQNITGNGILKYSNVTESVSGLEMKIKNV